MLYINIYIYIMRSWEYVNRDSNPRHKLYAYSDTKVFMPECTLPVIGRHDRQGWVCARKASVSFRKLALPHKKILAFYIHHIINSVSYILCLNLILSIASLMIMIKWYLALDFDQCSSTPCENNGKCFKVFYNYSCNCTADYTGANCELKKSQPNWKCLGDSNVTDCQIDEIKHNNSTEYYKVHTLKWNQTQATALTIFVAKFVTQK